MRVLFLLGRLFVETSAHAFDEVLTELIELPLLDVVQDVLPFMDGLHGIKNSGLSHLLFFGALVGQQVEQLLYYSRWVLIVLFQNGA